jgi:predicted RNA-binding Zn ribbon-like protein
VLQDPGNRVPAPEPLRLVQAFVNTVDLEHGHEELAGPGDLRSLLVRIGALEGDTPSPTDADLRTALELREALRVLLRANNGGSAPGDAVVALDRAARAAHLTLRFGDDGSARLVPETGGIDGALGRIVAVVYASMAAGTWNRMKACRRSVCYWAFYDRSKNRSSKWCAMSVCGNRTKKMRARRRT